MKLLFTILFQLIAFSIFSQKVMVKGVVVNENGESLYSTTICSQTNSYRYATTANLDGSFSLIAEKGDSLKFTRVGYSTFHYKVKAAGKIRVEMKQVNYVVMKKNYRHETWFGARSGPLIGKVLEESLNDSIVIEPKPALLIDSVEDNPIIFEKVEIGPRLPYDVGIGQKLRAGITNGMVSKLGIKGGEMKLSFLINTNGYVKNVSILSGATNEIDEWVTTNLKNIHFEAAEQNGRKVSVICEIELMLGIDDNKVFFFIKEFGWED